MKGPLATPGGRVSNHVSWGKNMRTLVQQETGNLSIERGGLYAKRKSGPRRNHAPPDHLLDRDVAGIYAGWKSNDGNGRYASKAVELVAQHITHPLRVVDRHMKDAIATDVPLERIRDLGRLLIRRVDVLAARFGKRVTPAA